MNQTNQMRMDGKNQDRNDAVSFGHTLSSNQDSRLQIILQNLNKLSSSAFTSKSRILVDCMVHNEIESFLMTEAGLNWPGISCHDQWREYNEKTSKLMLRVCP
jgi:hypothetical protein